RGQGGSTHPLHHPQGLVGHRLGAAGRLGGERQRGRGADGGGGGGGGRAGVSGRGEEATAGRRTAREAARAFIESSPVVGRRRSGRISDCKRRARPIGSRHGSYLEFRLTEGGRGQQAGGDFQKIDRRTGPPMGPPSVITSTKERPHGSLDDASPA